MISLDTCILMVTQMISQLVSSSGLWVPKIYFYGYQDSSFGVVKVSVFANDIIVRGEQLPAANITA